MLVQPSAEAEPATAEAPFLDRLFANYRWMVLATLSVATFAAAFLGLCLAKRPADGRVILRYAYESLQLFALNGPSQKCSTLPYDLAQFIAPLLTAGAIATALTGARREIRLLRLRRAEGHAVVLGMGAKGGRIALEYLRKNLRVVAVDRQQTAEIRDAEKKGAAVIVGDVRAEPILARARPEHARHVFCVTGEDATNVAAALEIAGRRARLRPQPPGPLRLFLRADDLDLGSALRLSPPFDRPQPNGLELSVFHPWSSVARSLFWRYPLDLLAPQAIADGRPVRIAILGFGAMGESLFRQAIRVSHFKSLQPVRILILDQSPRRVQRRIERRYPGLAAAARGRGFPVAEWSVEGCPAADSDRLAGLLSAPAEVDAFYACIPDESLAFACAWTIQRAFPRMPVFVRAAEGADPEAGAGAGAAAGTPFGAPVPVGPTAQACSAEAIAHDPLDEAARILHEAHCAMVGAPGGRPGTAPWKSLATQFRDANRHAVDHLPAKIRAIGRTWRSRKEPANPQLDDDVELLAEIEHRRWCAERYIEGWSYDPTRDDARRRHPDLVEWSALPSHSRNYDKNLVGLIPGLLNNLQLEIVPLP